MPPKLDPLLRLPEVIGKRATASTPAIRGLIPVSRSTWWDGVKSGRFPQPIRISARCVAWRYSDIANIVEQMASQAEGGVE